MKKLSLILVLICIATLTYAQNTPKTLFWKITKPGSNIESFLFGTFHEANPMFFDSLTNVVAKVKEADVVFVEERMFVAKTQVVKQPQWNAQKWAQLLTFEQKKIFWDFITKAEDSSYYNLNPLLLSLKVSRAYLMNFCQSPVSQAGLMDSHIEEMALRFNKSVYSLDINQGTIIKNQAERNALKTDSMYASFSIHYMENMLNNNLSDCKMLNEYKNFEINYQFDIDVLENTTDSWLLTERNKKWIISLDQSLKKEKCFIAVGIRHLFFKQGLIQQLRNLGYVITPVKIVSASNVAPK